MKKTMIVVVLVLALATLGFAQTVAEHIQAGDEAYAKFGDQAALDHYLEALKLEPENYEALWKASRGYVDVADLIPATDKDAKARQMKMYMEAVNLARKAIVANPNDTWGHFSLSASMGKRLLMLGKKEQIDGAKAVRAEIDKAIELDANNDLAWHALGRWQRRMAEIGGAKRFFGSIMYGSIPKGSYEESAKAFQTALELKPDYINHHYEYGLTLEALKKWDEARQEFQKCADLPISSSKDEMLKKDAATELAEIQNKK